VLPTEKLPAAGATLDDGRAAAGETLGPARARLPVAVMAAWAFAAVAFLVLATVLSRLVLPLRLVLVILGLFSAYRLVAALARWRRPASPPTGTWLAVGWLGLVVAGAVFAGVLPLPEGLNPAATFTVPALLNPGLHSGHLLGTDTEGLDTLTELIYGARISLIVGIGGTLTGLIVGGIAGMVSGYFGGPVDGVTSYIVDVLLTFPPLILLIAMVAFLSPDVLNITIVLGILALPGFARLARANTIKIASRDYVTASRTLGSRQVRILLKVIAPNLIPSLFAYSFIIMSFLIVAEASLSFLGVGIQRPTPTWGNMIAQGDPTLNAHPALVLAPAVAILFTVLSANFIGQRLQKRWGL